MFSIIQWWWEVVKQESMIKAKELMSNWKRPIKKYKHILQLSQLQNIVPSLPHKTNNDAYNDT